MKKCAVLQFCSWHYLRKQKHRAGHTAKQGHKQATRQLLLDSQKDMSLFEQPFVFAMKMKLTSREGPFQRLGLDFHLYLACLFWERAGGFSRDMGMPVFFFNEKNGHCSLGHETKDLCFLYTTYVFDSRCSQGKKTHTCT